VLLLALGTLFSHGQGTGSVTISVMPLGDSLTWGYDGGPDTTQYLNSLDTGGYRSPLYLALGAQGVNVNYVGASNGNPSPVLTAAGQTAQDGFNGYRIDDIANNLAGSVTGSDGVSNDGGYWLTGGGTSGRAAASPNIILLQIGANDMLQLYDPLFTGTRGTETAAQLATDTATRLESLINQIMYYEPNATLLVDGTSPLVNSAYSTAVSYDYDLDVANLVATQYRGTNVHYVDMWDALYNNPKTPGYLYYEDDGVHLNTLGYDEMAATWDNAILADYNFSNLDAVPEPSTWALLAGGALALFGWRKLRPRKS
jgi:lysophospholipase L1-like esterase